MSQYFHFSLSKSWHRTLTRAEDHQAWLGSRHTSGAERPRVSSPSAKLQVQHHNYRIKSECQVSHSHKDEIGKLSSSPSIPLQAQQPRLSPISCKLPALPVKSQAKSQQRFFFSFPLGAQSLCSSWNPTGCNFSTPQTSQVPARNPLTPL